jgi:hypothetical protein
MEEEGRILTAEEAGMAITWAMSDRDRVTTATLRCRIRVIIRSRMGMAMAMEEEARIGWMTRRTMGPITDDRKLMGGRWSVGGESLNWGKSGLVGIGIAR